MSAALREVERMRGGPPARRALAKVRGGPGATIFHLYSASQAFVFNADRFSQMILQITSRPDDERGQAKQTRNEVASAEQRHHEHWSPGSAAAHTRVSFKEEIFHENRARGIHPHKTHTRDMLQDRRTNEKRLIKKKGR